MRIYYSAAALRGVRANTNALRFANPASRDRARRLYFARGAARGSIVVYRYIEDARGMRGMAQDKRRRTRLTKRH